MAIYRHPIKLIATIQEAIQILNLATDLSMNFIVTKPEAVPVFYSVYLVGYF